MERSFPARTGVEFLKRVKGIACHISSSTGMFRCPLREAAVGLLAMVSGHADCIDLETFEVYYI